MIMVLDISLGGGGIKLVKRLHYYSTVSIPQLYDSIYDAFCERKSSMC